jgi:WD repeat-containing protein 35
MKYICITESNDWIGKDLPHELAFIEWAPDGRTILFGTPPGEVKVYDYLGNSLYSLPIYCLNEDEESPLASIHWFNGGLNGYITENYPENYPTLCIAYTNGKMQLMKHENDDSPILIDSGMTVNAAKWAPNGKLLAVGGLIYENDDPRSAIQFYDNQGTHLRTLRVFIHLIIKHSIGSWTNE